MEFLSGKREPSDADVYTPDPFMMNYIPVLIYVATRYATAAREFDEESGCVLGGRLELHLKLQFRNICCSRRRR